MNYIVYKTTNQINGKFYVGVHGTENPEIFDGYLGSGSYLKNAIKKHGKDNFIRETLVNCFEDHEEAFSIELMLVKTKDPRSYNLSPGGVGNISLGEKYSSIGGKISFEKNVGVHGASFQKRSEWGKLGGTLGGASARDNCVGLFSPEHQDRMVEYGLKGGNKCKDESIGFFTLSEQEMSAARLKGTINGMNINAGIHTTDSSKRLVWAQMGGKKSLGALFYNNDIRNFKFNQTRETITFNEFLSLNPQFAGGKIFVNTNLKSNSGLKAYHDSDKEYKFRSSNTADKILTEIEFVEFLSANKNYSRGRKSSAIK